MGGENRRSPQRRLKRWKKKMTAGGCLIGDLHKQGKHGEKKEMTAGGCSWIGQFEARPD